MKGYIELKNGLIAFRKVFKQQILTANDIKEDVLFFRTIINTDVVDWSSSDAFKLYKILQKFTYQLDKVGFDFKTIPEVKIQNLSTTYNTDRVIGFDGNLFKIRTPYVKEIVSEIQKINGRKYDSESRVWTVPLTRSKEVRDIAEKHKFVVGDKASIMLRNVKENLEQSYASEYIELNIPLTHPEYKLYGYQTVGVDYGRKNKRIINADQMGLGKTLQGLGIVVATNSYPSLIISPKTLRLNWKEEWESWTNKRVMILSHKNIKSLKTVIEKNLVDVVITNYDGVNTHFVEDIKEVEITKGKRAGTSYKKVYTNGLERLFKSVVLDEAHNCRNQKTIRFKSIKKCFEDKEVRVCLTGTPLVKGPNDLVALLTLIGRIEEFGGAWKFKKAFKGIGKDFATMSGKENVDQKLHALNVRLRSTCFIRREKHQVLKDLPDKFRKIIRVPLTNRKEYDHAYISLQSYLVEQNKTPLEVQAAMRAEVLVRINTLKQISGRGKFETIKEFAQDVVNGGEKLIIACWFNHTVAALKKVFPEAVQISGQKDGRDMKDEEIQEAKKKFQNDPDTKIIIITYGKGGEGHTLTAASKVALLELGWTYKDQAQMEDRAHRIGQKNTVECYYFLGEDTIDDDIYKIIESRRLIEKETTGGTEKIETTFSQITKKILNKSK